MEIRSILNKITENVFTSKNFVKTKEDVLLLLEECRVKDKDRMILDISRCKSLFALQKYCANSLLKYEGLGMNQLSHKKSKQEYEENEETI